MIKSIFLKKSQGRSIRLPLVAAGASIALLTSMWVLVSYHGLLDTPEGDLSTEVSNHQSTKQLFEDGIKTSGTFKENSKAHIKEISTLSASGENDDLLADSPEESRWLSDHGYPSIADLELMNELSTDQLYEMAKSGNQVAQVFLGARLALAEKDFERGMATLESAALNGSVYALTVAANVYSNAGNNTMAQGYRVAALLRGDYESIFVHDITNSFSNNPVPQWELSIGFLAGQAIIDRLNTIRNESGIGNFPPAIPRPGAESALREALKKLEQLSFGDSETGHSEAEHP